MPNGIDPVWMETVRIEIDRDRLRSHKGQQTGNGRAHNGGGVHGGANDALPSDFSIIVWNRLQGRGQAQLEKVEDCDHIAYHTVPKQWSEILGKKCFSVVVSVVLSLHQDGFRILYTAHF